ncbi:HPr-rel-A system PqqD family peptide chaperone [Sphingomonas sp. UNC305MFCol5.2]|uniref:HPr-rel-A system PqqD family peptide chaperone n=1 Tax=Sphingomonas sp. UNC305MFCol5.2 TaxID=1449076 RepID=UPI0004A7278F|nr:HPr-rel-A system PqqD family peptide chaperone [Sphingomonas sp. UNC305MFCol5.2]
MTLYKAAAPETLRIVPLDALTLVYHRSSGVTHIVDTPVPEILETLAEAPLTAPDLLARLGERFDLVDADPAALAVRLDELAAVGLVEQLCVI